MRPGLQSCPLLISVQSLGSLPQTVRVLVSTASSLAWAIDYSNGCPATLPVTDCASSRGGLYDHTRSSTYQSTGNSTLDVGLSLGLDDAAFYGLDKLSLGAPGGMVNDAHGSVATYSGTSYWLGAIGLNPRPIPGPGGTQKAFLQQLKDNGQISSLSYAYGEGASYRMGEKAVSSLTLGGYDAAMFQPTSITFPFNADMTRDLTVGIQSIRTTNLTSSDPQSGLEVEMMPQPIYALIDSTLPDFWLPTAACQAFESAFNLTFDSTANRYFLSASQHTFLATMNPSVSLNLGPDASPGTQSVNITLPYAAFDLSASWPIVDDVASPDGQRYFPLRRAANESQHRLGRVFLQETYLVADYERLNFTIAPRSWDSDSPSSLHSIVSLDGASSSPGQTPGAPSFDTIAGIVIGCVGGILTMLFLAMLLLLRRRRAQARRIQAARRNLSRSYATELSTTTSQRSGPVELKDLIAKHERWYISPSSSRPASAHQPFQPHLMHPIREASPSPVELPAPPRPTELAAPTAPAELDTARPSWYLPPALARSPTATTLGTLRSAPSTRTTPSIPTIVVDADAPAIELPAALPRELLERRRTEMQRRRSAGPGAGRPQSAGL